MSKQKRHHYFFDRIRYESIVGQLVEVPHEPDCECCICKRSKLCTK